MTQRPLPLLLLAAALAAPLVLQAQQPAFRSAIDVVSMNVTVIDSTSKYITDLTEKDFEIFEDGVKQDLTLFNRTNLPVALSLLIDTSSSMEDRMTVAQDAAIGFIRKLRPPTSARSSDSTAAPKCCRSSPATRQSSSRRFARRSRAGRRR